MDKLTNCPNCGAPITSCRCEYCGTVFRFQDEQEETKWLRAVKYQTTLDSLLLRGSISVHDYVERGFPEYSRPGNRDALIAYQIAR